MAREVHNGMDVIDSRDVIARIDELEQERQELVDALAEAESEFADTPTHDDEIVEDLQDKVNTAKQELEDWDDDNAEELKALQALAEQGEDSPDWKYGEALIRESYFETYAEELADDIGAIDKNASWPVNCIDWEEAADQLKQDYTEVDFDGVSYYIRS